MIREVINCQPTRPKYSNPDLGSIVADITNTVLSFFLHHRSAHQTLELVEVDKGLRL